MKNLSLREFVELYNERSNLYSSVADVTINTDELTPIQIAKKLSAMNQIEIKSSNKTTNLNFVDSIDDVLLCISKNNQIIFVDKTLKTASKALSNFLDERIKDVFLFTVLKKIKTFLKLKKRINFLQKKILIEIMKLLQSVVEH